MMQQCAERSGFVGNVLWKHRSLESAAVCMVPLSLVFMSFKLSWCIRFFDDNFRKNRWVYLVSVDVPVERNESFKRRGGRYWFC